MLTRRVFGMVLLGLPLVARAGKPKAEFWSGETIDKPEKGSIVVGGRHVRLRNRFTPKEVTMLSEANDNQQFHLWLVAPKQRDMDYQYLKVDGQWFGSDGTGGDQEGTKTTLRFDRATAARVAAALGIPVHERTKLDDGLRYTWRFPAKTSTDKTKPIEVVLRIDNTGKTTVGFMIGGRQRGPRDNRFVYVISRNGKPVAIKDAPDFGGIGYYQEIKPGGHAEVTCADLRAWADLDLPGFYTIEARYEGELAKDGKMPRTAAEQANVWDIVATGQGSILVQ